MDEHIIAVRMRRPESSAAETPIVQHRVWDTARSAAVVCDMWDAHHCRSAARRVADMATRVNVVLAGLRARGALIVHAPADCMDFYRETPARLRAARAPHAQPPVPIDWNDWEPDELESLSESITHPGACSCESAVPCGERFRAWTRQTPLIDVAPEDVVTDDGQELFNVLAEYGIDDVLVLGVHTNSCVLGRPYGIRQLVRLGKRPLLCRDLTDSFHRDPRGHDCGTEQVVAHIERRWCPTVTSDQLVGGKPFRFQNEV
jgi:nicotinamidase-related amidase